jgi:hypothetical protein
LRFTRDYSLGKLFSEKEGITVMLNLKQESNSVGFIALATLMFRHVINGPSTLKTIGMRMSADYQPIYELLFSMRNSEAGICSSPQLSLEKAQKVLRINTGNSFFFFFFFFFFFN